MLCDMLSVGPLWPSHPPGQTLRWLFRLRSGSRPLTSQRGLVTAELAASKLLAVSTDAANTGRRLSRHRPRPRIGNPGLTLRGARARGSPERAARELRAPAPRASAGEASHQAQVAAAPRGAGAGGSNEKEHSRPPTPPRKRRPRTQCERSQSLGPAKEADVEPQ